MHERTTRTERLRPIPDAAASRSPAIQHVAGRIGNRGMGGLLSGEGHAIEPQARAALEASLGRSFAGVRIHRGADATRHAAALRARAYTIGDHISFGAGEYEPDSASGRSLLAHELTHVAQQAGAEPTLQLAPQDAPTAAPGEADADRAARVAFAEQLRAEARDASLRMKDVLRGSWYLKDEDVMRPIRAFAARSALPGMRLTPLDYLIVAMRSATYTVSSVGTLGVGQWRSVFDHAHDRLSASSWREFRTLMATRARVFTNEEAIEMVKFEVTKEDVERGLKVGAELGAATLTGGASIVATIVSWLVKLYELYKQAKALVDLVTTIGEFKADQAKSFLSPNALGDMLVKALFGELRGLPRLAVDEAAEKESAGTHEGRGIMGYLQRVLAGLNVLKRGYNRIADALNGVLGMVNIAAQPWLRTVAGVYAAIVEIAKAIEDPAAAIAELAKGIRDAVSNFFAKIKGKIADAAGAIKEKLDLLASPAQLLKVIIDKAVEWVLNYLVTHPPSALLETAFQVAQEFVEGGNLVAAIRKKVPKADEFIKKIADSEALQTIFAPLRPPLGAASRLVTALADKALGIVGDVEARAIGIVSSGEQLLRELVGAPQPATSTAAARTEGEAPEDFLGTVKQGIHTRLMTIGKEALKSGAVQLAKKAGQAIVAKAKAIFARFKFTAGGESHELWLERSGDVEEVMVATAAEPVEQRVARYRTALSSVQEPARSDAEAGIKAIEELTPELKKVAAADEAKKVASDQLRDLEAKIATNIAKVDAALGLAAGKAAIEYRLDSRGRPSTAAGWLADTTTARDDSSVREQVMRPLRALAYESSHFSELANARKQSATDEQRETVDGAIEAAKNWNDWIHRLDGTHLIAHVLGGAGAAENIVPFDARQNKSWIKVSENDTRDRLKQADAKHTGERLYATVQAVYDDVAVAGLTGGAKVYKDAMDLMPDFIHYQVETFKDGKSQGFVIQPSKYPGGQIPAFLPSVRKADEQLAAAVLSGTRGEDLVKQFGLMSRYD